MAKLIEQLNAYPADTPVIVFCDDHGHHIYSPLDVVEDGLYVSVNTKFGFLVPHDFEGEHAVVLVSAL